MRCLVLVWLVVAGGCQGAGSFSEVRVRAPAELGDAIAEMVSFVDDPRVLVGEGAGGALAVSIVADLACRECYQLERHGDEVVVRGGAPLGVQYGLADLLEQMGFRFFHPFATWAPEELRLPEVLAGAGATQSPQTRPGCAAPPSKAGRPAASFASAHGILPRKGCGPLEKGADRRSVAGPLPRKTCPISV